MKILFTLLVITLTSFGSEYGEISGRIVDKQNLQPLESVNIYIARTTMGTSSDKNGEFTLSNIPPGRYRVILSHLSYKNHDFEIDVRKNSKVEFFIELLPTPIEFPEISVTDKYDTEWRDNFEVFSRALLGSTWFADGCADFKSIEYFV
ncbi:MAG: carboxypeptidase-like regulatory domain-containing protein [Melioribacteraceae bacterium]|nr:carboxypeptidase-like regulatory domain-containing protein [Melioribacteraceae bacterium]